MRPIGFSTGALAKGDFARGLDLQRSLATAVELSALRDHELRTLVDAIPHLDLRDFAYASLHAPSRLHDVDERDVFAMLSDVPKSWPIVAHPELLQTPTLWRELGARLCLENMDDRKSNGRTVDELRAMFDLYPDATFCLDLGHARQIDPSMSQAIAMLDAFGARLRELHVSEVGPRGEHLPMSAQTRDAFARIAPLVPRNCAVIVEAVVSEAELVSELNAVSALFAASSTP